MTDYNSPTQRKFPAFMALNEDIQLNILSFISDTPFATTDTTYTNNINENQLMDLCKSPLTHTLPLVSKHFRSLLGSKQADYLWKETLVRRIENEPFIWKKGMLSLITRWENNPSTAAALENTDDAEIILNAAYESRQKFYAYTSPVSNINQLLFRSLVSGYVRLVAPAFIMEGDAQIDNMIALHFFEPRYRILIRQVMANFPPEYSRGETIRGPNYPQFIYANNTPVSVSIPAVIVQVKQCYIHDNGEADVFLMPTAHVWLERIWVRPNSGRLHVASAIRMPEKASLNMEDNSAASFYTTHGHHIDEHTAIPTSYEHHSIFQILSEVYRHNRTQDR